MQPSGVDAHPCVRGVVTERDDEPLELLERVDLGTESARVTLSSGRRYELMSEGALDHLVVRSGSGTVLLRVAIDDEGPLLSFEGARIELNAPKQISLTAGAIELRAQHHLRVETEGSLTQHIAGDLHTYVGGEHRLEAASIAQQASQGPIAIRALESIALDGEHIGLNDDPCPRPFAWSRAAESETKQLLSTTEAMNADD
jgi:hypothetical protein